LCAFCDHAIFHRTDGDDVAGRPAEHLLGLFTNGLHLTGVLVERHDGRLIDDDAFALGEYECVRSSEVDGQVGGKEAKKRAEIH